MQRNTEKGPTWPQVRYWLMCFALIVIGVVGTIWGGPFENAQPVVKELGPGIFTAGILASLVEPFFRHEFARDAFRAAFQYVLPTELKEEVQRVINYKFLCTYSRMIVRLEPVPVRDLVRVHISVEKKIKNVTRHTETLLIIFALDEWGFSGFKSQIDECKFDAGNGLEECPNDPDNENNPSAAGGKKAVVKVGSGQEVRVIMKGSEIHRDNGELRGFQMHASVNPIVDIRVPTDFKCGCTFGVPGEKINPSNIDKSYTLDGTQFPGQCTYIRWWRERSAA